LVSIRGRVVHFNEMLLLSSRPVAIVVRGVTVFPPPTSTVVPHHPTDHQP